MTINLNISDTANPAIAKMVAELKGPQFITAAAGAVRIELRDFFAGLERSRANKQGWPRQHFWADVRNTVQNPIVPDPSFATVSITDKRYRQRLEGGFIRPTPGKTFLTIPANEKAYGHRAREFATCILDLRRTDTAISPRRSLKTGRRKSATDASARMVRAR
ncbi:MAG: hypothetical protein HC901_00345 [Bdellovibrionaceae bacterium]|nr:hypothetical protein [Pseudobdellovibrionaceae bacterium]